MSEQKYFYITQSNKSPKGPYYLSELERMVQMGEIDDDALIAAAGDTEWVPLRSKLHSGACCGMPDLPPIPTHLVMPAIPSVAEVGPCPDCGKKVPLGPDGQIPVECPHCRYLFRAENPSSFWGNIQLTFKKLTVFKGRATRMEFWYFYLFNYIVSLCITMPLAVMQISSMTPTQMRLYEEQMFLVGHWDTPAGIIQLVQIVLSLVFMLLQLSVTVRRLHDVGKSATLLALLYLPIPLMLLLAFGLINSANSPLTTLWTLLGIVLVLCIFLMAVSIALLVAVCTDSKPGSNRYGLSPKYPTNLWR